MQTYPYTREAICRCGKTFLKDAPGRKKCDTCRLLKNPTVIRKSEPKVPLTQEQRNYADFVKRLFRF
jgi:hypothetical protein